ncbi:MAG TPA: YceI family protein [Wenzhouxiangellaceae bacterium]|nr:YceI family protein [Wenzhouxiangellaceae bacterium]
MMNVFTPVAIVMLAASSSIAAEQTCFVGSHETGELAFSGAVEGTGFTGRFGEFSVKYCMPESGPADGRIDVQVNLSSADTENRERDETLKGEEFFAVGQYPEAVWTSHSISADADEYVADGDLELKGIKASQPIRFTLTPDGDDLFVSGKFSMAGDAEVERLRFDVGTGDFADPEFVRNRVDVTFEIRLQAQD